jgi:hypothetical protein
MCDAAFIKRDHFVNRVLSVETDRLRQQLAGRRQSNEAKRFVSQELKRLGPKLVNWQVEKDTAASFTDVCEQANVCRDAVVNRIVFFLTAPGRLLGRVGLAHEDFSWQIGDLRALELASQIMSDPLSPIHEAFERADGVKDDQRLYLADIFDIGSKVRLKTGEVDSMRFGHGLSVYLDDVQVPGTAAYRETQVSPIDLLSLLDDEPHDTGAKR